MLVNAVVSAALLIQGAVAAPLAGHSFVAPTKSDVSNALQNSNIGYTIGAPVLTNAVNIYYIYYGTFTKAQETLLEGFIKTLDTSAWWSMTKSYYYQASASSKKVYVNGTVTLAKTVHDNYSLGKSLSGNALPNIIQAQIDAGALPEDDSAVYFVLTAGDVSESIRDDLGSASFCSDYCGYHVSWQLTSGKRIFYSMVGLATACSSGCTAFNGKKDAPNGDVAADGILSVIAHELTEAVTDPQSDGTRAWQFSSGYENADQCAWTFGTIQKTSSGAQFNVEFGGKKYLIQQNWNVVKQQCGLA